MINLSLVVPTLNRKSELYRFLDSIESQDSIDFLKIEVIIVDQNPRNYLINLESYNNKFKLIHIFSNTLGVSYNKNLGILSSSGEIIAFPDDDCLYKNNTIKEVLHLFNQYKIDFIAGQVLDSELRTKIFKSWPNSIIPFSKLRFYFLTTSINMFFRRKSIFNFDECMGIGSKYGSCEDTDFVFKIITRGGIGIYNPLVTVFHPAPNYLNIKRDKVFTYASGFGYFISKYKDATLYFLLIMLLAYKVFQLLSSFMSKNKYYNGYFKDFFSGLFSGFFRIDKQFKG
jgi:glycosyltransferase involved in cell wall biosynthesis